MGERRCGQRRQQIVRRQPGRQRTAQQSDRSRFVLLLHGGEKFRLGPVACTDGKWIPATAARIVGDMTEDLAQRCQLLVCGA